MGVEAKQHGFHVDARRCTGCRACVLSCRDYHNLSESFAFRQVYEFVGGGWSQDADGIWVQDCFVYHLSIACNHCSDPACIHACPTGAMHRDRYGLVIVDEHRCIGCGYCAFACPYRAPKVDRDLGRSVKCDGCLSRLDQGLRPVCEEACPVRAIDFGPVDDLVSRFGSLSDIPPLPERRWTYPNVFITPPACFDELGIERLRSGSVANHREIF